MTLRRKSIRYAGYDYSQPGSYAFTAVVKQRACVFGNIDDGQMALSSIGEVVWDVWRGLPSRFPVIVLDAFVVMPNHIHGIVFLGGNTIGQGSIASEPPMMSSAEEVRLIGKEPPSEAAAAGIVPDSQASLPSNRRPVSPRRDPQAPNLGEIVRSLKAASTTIIRKSYLPEFGWQRNYWERIIRNDRELDSYRAYIEGNPERWLEDQEYLKGDW